MLWEPSEERMECAGITGFIHWLNQYYRLELTDYGSLWKWSTDNIESFWAAIATRYGVFSEEQIKSTEVLAQSDMPGADWFPDLSLNFANYLLRQGEAEHIAIYAESEARGTSQITWTELREQVTKLATYLRAIGVKRGDYVSAYLPMSTEAVVTLLATTSIGAIWSSCSPDFGSSSVVERFFQVKPKVLITVSGYQYAGKYFDRAPELDLIVKELSSLTDVIYIPWCDGNKRPHPGTAVNVTDWDSALDNDMTFDMFEAESVPFSHPLWVLYTSGTTGLPKGIVHGHGGILLEFIKSAWLHDDLGPGSIKFFFTTTGWTMFNLLVGGLVAGGSIVVYDGSPTHPGLGRLFDFAEKLGVTYFGTSPAFVNTLIEKGFSPKESHDLSSIKTIALTGSPAAPITFEWFYKNLHEDLHIISMSGGTDVAAAFVGGTPVLPVHAGQIQAPCLGVDVRAFNDDGDIVVDEYGELVVTQPMPSMPVYFINDPDYQRYMDSYFGMYKGIWRQGDFIRFQRDGRCIISGRSDSTLNRYGIRVGTAEIYRAIEKIDGLADSLIINLELAGARFFMPLFVALENDRLLDGPLITLIEQTLKSEYSPRYVPDRIYQIEEVPYTLSGKKLEIPVKKLLSGQSLESAVNLDSVRNPAALDYFVNLAKTIEEYY